MYRPAPVYIKIVFIRFGIYKKLKAIFQALIKYQLIIVNGFDEAMIGVAFQRTENIRRVFCFVLYRKGWK